MHFRLKCTTRTQTLLVKQLKIEGFKPKSPQAWYSTDWSNRCDRNKVLSCEEKNNAGFVKLSGILEWMLQI